MEIIGEIKQGETKMKQNKFITVLRKNLSYLVVAFCILAVGFAVVFVMITQDQAASIDKLNEKTQEILPVAKEPDIDVEPITEPTSNIPETTQESVSFIMPVGEIKEITPYSDTMVYNSTLKRFSAHLATDFFASEGTPVFAVYDGVVESVDNSLLQGVSVTIDHGNGLKTVYNSLEDADDVTVNAKVKQGDIIGHVSTSNRQESTDGAHLHFEVVENGSSINPAKYLAIEEK